VLLKKDPRITGFTVQAVNQESIHAHDAFARVIWRRKRSPKAKASLANDAIRQERVSSRLNQSKFQQRIAEP
jgi:hypothetical protein